MAKLVKFQCSVLTKGRFLANVNSHSQHPWTVGSWDLIFECEETSMNQVSGKNCTK